jgi:hypothetical protein
MDYTLDIMNADLGSFGCGDVMFVDEISLISGKWYSIFAKL